MANKFKFNQRGEIAGLDEVKSKSADKIPKIKSLRERVIKEADFVVKNFDEFLKFFTL